MAFSIKYLPTIRRLAVQTQRARSNFQPPPRDSADQRPVVKTKLELFDDKAVEANHPSVLEELARSFVVREDFLSEKEEKSIFDEIEPYMKKLRYEFDHWDNAIHGYRETERTKWSQQSTEILNRVRTLAFEFKRADSSAGLLEHVHILDLHKDGFIKPHVDAVRFCGNTIAGICLLSDCVMRLTSEKDKNKFANVLLKRRSMYIMK